MTLYLNQNSKFKSHYRYNCSEQLYNEVWGNPLSKMTESYGNSFSQLKKKFVKS